MTTFRSSEICIDKKAAAHAELVKARDTYTAAREHARDQAYVVGKLGNIDSAMTRLKAKEDEIRSLMK